MLSHYFSSSFVFRFLHSSVYLDSYYPSHSIIPLGFILVIIASITTSKEILGEVQYNAAMLKECGHAVDVDDLNEGSEGECRLVLLEMKPATDSLPSTRILKRKGKGAATKPAKWGKKTSE